MAFADVAFRNLEFKPNALPMSFIKRLRINSTDVDKLRNFFDKNSCTEGATSPVD